MTAGCQLDSFEVRYRWMQGDACVDLKRLGVDHRCTAITGRLICHHDLRY